MATQLIATPNLRGGYVTGRVGALAGTDEHGNNKWARLIAYVSRVWWRFTYELEPIFRGPLASDFTTGIRRCQGLSTREKSQLETLCRL